MEYDKVGPFWAIQPSREIFVKRCSALLCDGNERISLRMLEMSKEM